MGDAPFTSFLMNDGHFLCQSSQVNCKEGWLGSGKTTIQLFEVLISSWMLFIVVPKQEILTDKDYLEKEQLRQIYRRPGGCPLASFTFIPVQWWSICQALKDHTRACLARVFKEMFQLRNIFCSAGKFAARTIDPGTTDVNSSSAILSDKIGRSRWVFTKHFIQIANIFSQRFQNSFAEIARLLSEFFRDLDVVPTDVLVRPTSIFFLLTNLFILHYHPSKIIASLPHNIWLHQCHHPHDQVDLLLLRQIS